jgi:hypothetical protein
MIRFYADHLAVAITNLTMAQHGLDMAALLVSPEEQQREGPAYLLKCGDVLKFLQALQAEMNHLDLPVSLLRSVERLIHDVEHEPFPVAVFADRLNSTKFAICDELGERLFFRVTKPQLYLDPEGWFGSDPMAAFPGISKDVRDACRCQAAGQWTAAVFHAMRILEQGLHKLCRELQVPFKIDVELENWGAILEQLERKIRTLEASMSKSLAKDAWLQYYSKAASHFHYFKGAWRNQVSHSRSHYDEQEATEVLDAVKRFFGHLAKGAPPMPPPPPAP